MATIVVFGGRWFTGGNVVREAAARGHRVVAVSRSEPQDPIEGVHYETGAAEQVAERVIPGADAVVAALSPRGDMLGRLVEVYRGLARQSAAAGARYIQVGGFSSLRPAAGAPRFVEGEIPEQFRDEAVEGEATRVLLAEESPEELDWVFVSPAASYGAWAAGERTSSFRVGDDVALFDEEGDSTISGADFAAAIVEEIERPSRHRAHERRVLRDLSVSARPVSRGPRDECESAVDAPATYPGCPHLSKTGSSEGTSMAFTAARRSPAPSVATASRIRW